MPPYTPTSRVLVYVLAFIGGMVTVGKIVEFLQSATW